MTTETDTPPPKTKYELTLVIHGNSHEEVERELMYMTRGGYLLDSDYHKRDEFRVIGGRKTSTLRHINPEQTPERYEQELHDWAEDRRAKR